MPECNLKLNPDRRVKVEVINSQCDALPAGSAFSLKGPFIEGGQSGPVCVTALLGIYPWIVTARFGIESSDLGWQGGYRIWCPEKKVEFLVKTMAED